MYKIILMIAFSFLYSVNVFCMNLQFHEVDFARIIEMSSLLQEVSQVEQYQAVKEILDNKKEKTENTDGYLEEAKANAYDHALKYSAETKERTELEKLIDENAKTASICGRTSALFLIRNMDNNQKLVSYILAFMFDPNIKTFVRVTGFAKESGLGTAVKEIFGIDDEKLNYRNEREDESYVYRPPLAYFVFTKGNIEKLIQLLNKHGTNDGTVVEILNAIKEADYIEKLPARLREVPPK